MERIVLCAQANEFDLVDYLKNLGHQPQKVRGDDYWYLSPLRQERTPSFKVNRKANVWYDHGIGKGGRLVDFGVLFYGCSVKEFLQKLEAKPAVNFSFHQPRSIQKSEAGAGENKLAVTAAGTITSPSLCRYLSSRKIPLELGKQHLKEVSFELHGKSFSALGFQNNSGGFELRNEYFKGSSAPKDVTLTGKTFDHLAVFEGCFSFLSYLDLHYRNAQDNSIELPEMQTNFLVLNSLSFLEKSRSAMESHASILLFLDRDTAGVKATEQALHWSSKYKDRSSLYAGHKDLNDFLIHQQKTKKGPSLRRGRHF